MAVFDEVILQSNLEIDKRQHLVTLTSSRIILEANRKKKDTENSATDISYRSFGECIDLKEVIAVKLEKPPPAKDKFKTTDGNKVYLCIEMNPLKPNSFSVYYIKRIPRHRWRYKQITFMTPEFEVCQMWVDRLQDELYRPEKQRPNNLLVFINPFGGKKKAAKLYREKIAPLFKLADICTDIVVTTHGSHAYDVLQDYDLSKIDGVVGVGGDGTFSELMNGLLARTSKDKAINRDSHHEPTKPDLRIGIIPAGSTDAVVCTTVGTNDPVTSALHIILGDRTGIDVCALYNNDKFIKYSVTMMAYGFYGDVLEDSESFRWMGPKRYSWSGFKKFLTKKCYDGEVSFLLSPDSPSQPLEAARCLSGCSVCSEAAKKSETELLCDRAKEIGNQVSRDGWHKVKGKFVAINSYSMSCRSPMTPDGVSPTSHLGDGSIDLVLVFNCSRVEYLRHLYRCTDRNSDQFNFDFIQTYRVKEFKFEPPTHSDYGDLDENAMHRIPLRAQHSVWNCDGEIVEFPNLHVRVHCQLIQLFARGVEEEGKFAEAQCF